MTRRAFQSTALDVEENTTFGMSRQRRANSICAGVAPGCWSAVGQWEKASTYAITVAFESCDGTQQLDTGNTFVQTLGSNQTTQVTGFGFEVGAAQGQVHLQDQRREPLRFLASVGGGESGLGAQNSAGDIAGRKM